VEKIIAPKLIENNMTPNILLKINVPYLSLDEIKGFSITRQELRVYRDEVIRREEPRGRPYYWIGGDSPTGVPEEGTDIGALSEGFVSITPISLDLTAYDCLEHFQKWNIKK
jgi:5'-nucleotidase